MKEFKGLQIPLNEDESELGVERSLQLTLCEGAQGRCHNSVSCLDCLFAEENLNKFIQWIKDPGEEND